MLEEGAKTARASTALVVQQYKVGLTPYTNVLQTHATQAQAENMLAQSHSALTTNLVSVYKALGRGRQEDAALAAKSENNPLFRQ